MQVDAVLVATLTGGDEEAEVDGDGEEAKAVMVKGRWR